MTPKTVSRRGFPRRVLFTAAVIAAGMPSLLRGQNSSGKIVVARLAGKVSIAASTKGPWKPIAKEKELKAPVTVKTGEGAWVEFVLSAGSRIRVPEKSTVEIEKALKDEDVEIILDVKNGRVLCLARIPTEASKFEVMNPYGICGARESETGFEVLADGIFRCCSGTLAVVYIISSTPHPPIMLKAGEQTFPPNPEGLKKEQAPKKIREKVCGEIEKLRGPGSATGDNSFHN